MTLSPDRQSARMSKITKEGRLNTVWHRMFYSCTHMATMGVKGLTICAVLTISNNSDIKSTENEIGASLILH